MHSNDALNGGLFLDCCVLCPFNMGQKRNAYISACLGYYWLYDFTDHQIQVVVNEHNRLRRLEPASNMQEMVWNQNLAEISKDLASLCLAQHSSAGYRTNRANFRAIGESLWWRSEHRMRDDLRIFIQNLYDEKPFYDFRSDTCQRNQMCGHYKQLVWATSCAIGCSAAYCEKILDRGAVYPGHMGVCHYGPAGNYHWQPYVYGRQCASCPGQCRNGLCPSTCTAIYPNRNLTAAHPQWYNKIWPQQSKDRSAQMTGTSCKNSHVFCEYWALKGECKMNPHYMDQFCRFSCKSERCS